MRLKKEDLFYKKAAFFQSISFVFAFILVFTSFAVSIESYQSNLYGRKDAQTELEFTLISDGSFSGWWNSRDQSLDGVLSGSIEFGRSDTIARLTGVLSVNSSNSYFGLDAWVMNNIVVGMLFSTVDGSQMFIGRIQVQMPEFSFTVYANSNKIISGGGTFDGSFLPAPTGPYQVGVHSFHLIDDSREEWFTEDDVSDVRELMVKVWYPTEDNDFSDRADYMDPITFSWLRNQGPVPLVTIPKDAYRFVHPYIYEEVEPVSQTCFPVLLFSPGYDGVDTIYTSFIDELVSQGYVVVSMNHPFVSGVTVFPGGRVVYIADLPGNFSESADFLKQSQQTVINDTLFTLDFIEQLNQTDDMLSGIFDCSRVGMFGHSFGGAATMNCCFLDDRIKAGFTLDGVVYNEFITGAIDTPFLLMCAEQRFNHSSYEYVWNQFTSDAFQVGVVGSSHYGYTDVGVLLSHMLPLIPSSTLGFGTVDARSLIILTRCFEHAFFDVYLKGAEKEELIDLFDNFDDVLIRIK